ncbi:MAG: phosphoenolpyruvate synthase [Chlamydiales bacterium]
MKDKSCIEYVRFFENIHSEDVPIFGGKNASLGEMMLKLHKRGVAIPRGFATTADAYWEFLEFNKIKDKIRTSIEEYKKGKSSLKKAGKNIRKMILKGEFPVPFRQGITEAYEKLSEMYQKKNLDVAVRSSGTAEDLPSASFAGQQETYLNIKGKNQVLEACKKCIASLFTDRAIYYRENHGFDHLKIALSIGVQKMVRSDRAGSGVMFTLDTETGFPDFTIIDATWGLGELIVQGNVDPDEYVVYKPLLENKSVTPIIDKTIGTKKQKIVYNRSSDETTRITKTSIKEQKSSVLDDDEILMLARWGSIIESHYGRAMDIEWAKDGNSGELFIVQARPETVHSQHSNVSTLKTYHITSKGKKLITGLSIGNSIAVGEVQKLKNPKEQNKFKEGDVLVTAMTDPDWVPIMKKAAGIVTDHGGRTSHAAIVSRELGIPAIVGTEKATKLLQDKTTVTLSCCEGKKGFVYSGKAEYSEQELNLQKLPKVKTQLMLNIADPASAISWWKLPTDGVGLARMEFIISNDIKIHPMALVQWKKLKDEDAKKKIADLTEGYKDKSTYFVEKLASGIAKIAAIHYPNPVIVRFSDFKTNEYAELIGGKEFEPKEENPMLGWRGASRYNHPDYEKGFAMECLAIRHVREKIGLQNVIVMVPFCRTVEEADAVLNVMRKHGLVRGLKGLSIYMMCEIPSNVVLADKFSQRFDGFSIGSNDLTQLMLGVDRDSDIISQLFDERNSAVKLVIKEVIKKVQEHHCHIGICGQAPSDYPDYAGFLVEAGIDSISVLPDSFGEVIKIISKKEREKKIRAKGE